MHCIFFTLFGVIRLFSTFPLTTSSFLLYFRGYIRRVSSLKKLVHTQIVFMLQDLKSIQCKPTEYTDSRFPIMPFSSLRPFTCFLLIDIICSYWKNSNNISKKIQIIQLIGNVCPFNAFFQYFQSFLRNIQLLVAYYNFRYISEYLSGFEIYTLCGNLLFFPNTNWVSWISVYTDLFYFFNTHNNITKHSLGLNNVFSKWSLGDLCCF